MGWAIWGRSSRNSESNSGSTPFLRCLHSREAPVPALALMQGEWTVLASEPPVPDLSPAYPSCGACLGNQQISLAKGGVKEDALPQRKNQEHQKVTTCPWPRSPNFYGLKDLEDLAQVLHGTGKKKETQRGTEACQESHSTLEQALKSGSTAQPSSQPIGAFRAWR